MHHRKEYFTTQRTVGKTKNSTKMIGKKIKLVYINSYKKHFYEQHNNKSRISS